MKSLVETQHRSMVRQLCDGAFDDVIEERLGAGVFGDTTETDSTTAPIPGNGDDVGLTEPLPPPASFGEGIVSEKRLDEVVLSFLVENAQRRKRSVK